MDDSRFDSLARALGRSVDRRAGLRGAVVALAGGVGLAAVAAAGPADEQCLRNGQRCGKKSGNNGRQCKDCCSRYWTNGKKRKRCTCKPDGMHCNNSSQCCNGTCDPATSICGGSCLADFEPCETDDQCCGDRCFVGKGSFCITCVALGGACEGDEQCCDQSSVCSQGICVLD